MLIAISTSLQIVEFLLFAHNYSPPTLVSIIKHFQHTTTTKYRQKKLTYRYLNIILDKKSEHTLWMIQNIHIFAFNLTRNDCNLLQLINATLSNRYKIPASTIKCF